MWCYQDTVDVKHKLCGLSKIYEGTRNSRVTMQSNKNNSKLNTLYATKGSSNHH